MDVFDKRVIGYSSAKDRLRQIADCLIRSDEYKMRGAQLPHGLLMVSAPGTGKSTLADCLIKTVNRKTIVFKKDSESNSFLVDMKKAFEQAKDNSPSIILLEDIHLYGSNAYASEWAGLQSAIDECKNDDVFVIATANTLERVTESLLRPGRFDYVLKLDTPKGETAEAIIAHYLEDKNLDDDICISDIVKVLDNCSCATLESTLNVASLNAIYEDSDTICKRHMVDAIMQVVFQMRRSDREFTSFDIETIAVHEASHAVVAEVLRPEHTSVVTLLTDGEGSVGMTGIYERGFTTEDEMFDLVTINLAGKAGTDLMYGRNDMGTLKDLDNAYQYLAGWATELAGGGFCSLESSHRSTSEASIKSHEDLIASKMDELYMRAKKILCENRDYLERVRDALLEKGTLLNSDVVALR